MNANAKSATDRATISLMIAPRRLLTPEDEDELQEWLMHWRTQRTWTWHGTDLRGSFTAESELTEADALDLALTLTFHSDVALVACSAPHEEGREPVRWLTVRPEDPVLQSLRDLYRQCVIDASAVVRGLRGFSPPRRRRGRRRQSCN
jgi:hypothetical protein